MFDEWDELVADGFELLADPASYMVAATGATHEVGVIPIDEAETWAAKKGDLQATGTKVVARLYAAQLPDVWTGPDATGADVLLHKGRRWKVKPTREELNRVWVVELSPSARR